jgi:nucleoside-diphosphate-sugar epimerase
VNIAEVIRAATSSRFHGVVNAGDKSTPSVLEIGLAIGKIMNWEWSFTLLPDEADISAGGESPWSVPYPFLLDMTRARSLGYVETTTYEDYLTSYCRWMVGVSASGDWKAEFCDLSDSLFDYAAEDTVVSRHSGAL